MKTDFEIINLQTAIHPILLRLAAITWDCEAFADRLLEGDLAQTRTSFRICKIIDSSVREHHGTKVTATMQQFCEWASDHELRQNHPFHAFPTKSSRQAFAYADYKHFVELFDEIGEQSIDWGHFETVIENYPMELSSQDSTLWLGSIGAHTPLHFDSYGCNVVVQVSGRKRWRLWNPCASIKPIRVPYEESSIYSDYDPLVQNTIPPDHDFILEPGDVLFIPKHYWHFVETVSDIALSINQWLPVESDATDRLSEAIVRLAFGSIASALHECGVDVQDKASGWISESEAVNFTGDVVDIYDTDSIRCAGEGHTQHYSTGCHHQPRESEGTKNNSPTCTTSVEAEAEAEEDCSKALSCEKFTCNHDENLRYLLQALDAAKVTASVVSAGQQSSSLERTGTMANFSRTEAESTPGHEVEEDGNSEGSGDEDFCATAAIDASKIQILQRIVSNLLHPDNIRRCIEDALG